MPFLLLITLRKIIYYILSTLTHFIRTDTLMLSAQHVSHMKIFFHLEGKEMISIAREVYMHDLKVRA